MKVAIEISAEDITRLDKYLARVLAMGRIGFASPTYTDNILARVFDAYVAECARKGADAREGDQDEAN